MTLDVDASWPACAPNGSGDAFQIGSDGILRCLALGNLPWLVHGFTTRRATNWQQGMPVAALKQIHSAIVVTPQPGQSDCGEGDALTTSEANLLLSVRTADCVPVLLASRSAPVAAAVHAGWRGVVGEVLPATIRRLQRSFGVEPSSLMVAIGPCIRQAAFEVGHEVARQFAPLFPEREDLMADAQGAPQKPHIDLAAACRRQLHQATVPDRQIFDCGYCTYREEALFHSYRRDREAAGRMHAFVGLRAWPDDETGSRPR